MESKNTIEVQPNPEFLKKLTEMGISEDTARNALITTNNESLEMATSLALDMSESDWVDLPDNFKMTFVVNISLKMGVGKIASQVAHAAVSLYQQLTLTANTAEQLEMWQQIGEKKIVLCGHDDKHLTNLESEAHSLNIPCSLIRDAGKTQIPENSITVLALFGLEDEVNKITGNLKLLK